MPSDAQVSFQHESYPVVMPPAASGQDMEGAGLGEQPLSRQVFIVQELEVRDRLASSQINKFLYLYTSESMPRRAHSNMVSMLHEPWNPLSVMQISQTPLIQNY